jgi:hypothetical protein
MGINRERFMRISPFELPSRRRRQIRAECFTDLVAVQNVRRVVEKRTILNTARLRITICRNGDAPARMDADPTYGAVAHRVNFAQPGFAPESPSP